MSKSILAFCLAMVCVSSAFGQDRERILGTWKLESVYIEFHDSGERKTPFGANPNGYIIFTPEGRMMALLTPESRKAPQTDAERAEAFKSMYAYSGIYRLEGDRFITKVDTAWNEAWVGTDQVRYYRFEGEKLIVTSAWAASPNFDGRRIRGILTWEKSK